MSELIPLEELPAKVPTWPMSAWSTRRLIREGLLGRVKIGRRLFVTREILEEYIRANTAGGKSG